MYYQVNVDLSDAQLRKLGYAMKYGESVTLEIQKSQLGKGKSELMLTKTQINKLDRTNSAVRIKLSVTQLKAQTGEGLLDSIIAIGKTLLPKALPILGSLGLAGATGAISGLANKAVTGKKKGGALPLMVTIKDIEMILDMIDKLEKSGALPKGTHQVISENVKQQDGGFIGTLLASLAGPLLANLLGGKGLERAGNGLTRAGSKN